MELGPVNRQGAHGVAQDAYARTFGSQEQLRSAVPPGDSSLRPEALSDVLTAIHGQIIDAHESVNLLLVSVYGVAEPPSVENGPASGLREQACRLRNSLRELNGKLVTLREAL